MSQLSKYYQGDTLKLIKFLVPPNTKKVIIKNAQTIPSGKTDYLILENIIGDLEDVQNYLAKIKRNLKPRGRLIVIYYNHLWEPLLKLASFMGWRKDIPNQNWLDSNDIVNLLTLTGFDVITHQRRLLFPIYIPIISTLINNLIAPLPLVNSFCLTTWVIARLRPEKKKDYSVSIIVPARNEAGNIPKIPMSIPAFGKRQEIIFIEGHSKDNTWEKIQKELNKKYRKDLKIQAYRQAGEGKADAVRLGFKKAKGDVLMILDADLTVNPKDLKKFYETLAVGAGEFINGSRLVYPMEKQAMRFLNKIANNSFGWLFTWILGQRFKDTLCGTKAILQKDYEWILKNRKYFGDFDPFGDFELIFGAIKQNLKAIEIPVRYKERVYGSTNISRFKHGLLLAKMTIYAFMKFRAY